MPGPGPGTAVLLCWDERGRGSRSVHARGLTMSSRGREAAQGNSRRESGIEASTAGPARDPRSRGRAGVDRVVRGGAPGVPALEHRGRRLRDPDRLDGTHPDGTAQGDRLPGVWLCVHGQRRPRGRTGPDRPRRRSADRLGDVRELPLRVAGRRRAQLLGGPDLRHEAGRVAALLRRGGPGPPEAVGCRGLQAAGGARGPLHQAAGGDARRGPAYPGGRRLGPAAGRPTASSGRSGRSTISRPCR